MEDKKQKQIRFLEAYRALCIEHGVVLFSPSDEVWTAMKDEFNDCNLKNMDINTFEDYIEYSINSIKKESGLV